MSKGIKILLIGGGIILMLGACAVLIYILVTQTLFNNISTGGKSLTIVPTTISGGTSVPAITGVVSATSVPSVTPPSDWIFIDNTSQHYLAYRPNHWYFRLFAPAMETLGIDTNAIPEASEWAGIITMTRLTASNNFDAYKANLEAGYTTQVQNISGRSWTIINGKTPANALFDSQFVKYAYVTVDGKEFLAEIRSTAADFGGQLGNFNIFVQTISFY